MLQYCQVETPKHQQPLLFCSEREGVMYIYIIVNLLFLLVLVLAFRVHRKPAFEDTLALLKDLEDAP